MRYYWIYYFFQKKCSSRFTQLCKFAKLLQELHFNNIEHICLYESRHYPSFTYPCSNLMKELRYQFTCLCFVSLPNKKNEWKMIITLLATKLKWYYATPIKLCKSQIKILNIANIYFIKNWDAPSTWCASFNTI